MFKTIFTRLLPVLFMWSGMAMAVVQPAPAPAMAGMAAETTGEQQIAKSTADHSKFKELDKVFKSGPEVTKACLSCHTEASRQLHKTKHWTWDYINPQTNQRLGKNQVINNFCTAVPSNYKFCTACHIGYGWEDQNFDFTSEANVDCMVCHDTTGKYKKLPGLAGHTNYETIEWPPHSGKFRAPTDLKAIAQGVGPTSRQTCGACHFRGGGGDAVKHGDLDSSLEFPLKSLDVHMDAKGLNFTCSRCHVTESHEVSGSRNQVTAADDQGHLIPGSTTKRNPTTCVACHDNNPHDTKHDVLNRHTAKLACQTCHIPAYAREMATKMEWDWSTTGKLDEQGHRIQIKGSDGNDIYDSKKGDFRWEKYVIPEYQWFNGEVIWTLADTRFDPNQILKINSFQGSPDDGKSRIWPTKVFRGKQMYDKVNNNLVVTSLSDDKDSALWINYDVNKAVAAGMKIAGKPYSGEAGFVATEMSWPITHMVAPKEGALECAQCHQAEGRLQGIPGVYMPATNNTPILDKLGFIVALLTLVGVLGHGAIRYFMYTRGK